MSFDSSGFLHDETTTNELVFIIIDSACNYVREQALMIVNFTLWLENLWKLNL